MLLATTFPVPVIVIPLDVLFPTTTLFVRNPLLVMDVKTLLQIEHPEPLTFIAPPTLDEKTFPEPFE